MCLSKTEKAESLRQIEIDRKNIVIEYFKLEALGMFKQGIQFFASDCKTHNPFMNVSIEGLIDAMVAGSKDFSMQSSNIEFKVQQILADGDLVAAYTTMLNNKSKPSEGGLRQIHLFRFKGDKIVEYWDVTQQIMPNMPNAEGAF